MAGEIISGDTLTSWGVELKWNLLGRLCSLRPAGGALKLPVSTRPLEGTEP